MGMSTGGSGGPMAEINVTPLVDVMLVLLIIFMVTAPTLSYENPLDLPQPSPEPPPEAADPPPPITLKIDEFGNLMWNDQPIMKDALMGTMRLEASAEVQPVLQLDIHEQAQYQMVAEVLADAKNSGLEKIGFIEQL